MEKKYAKENEVLTRFAELSEKQLERHGASIDSTLKEFAKFAHFHK